MPAVRLSRRRRSSLALSFNPAKAGYYGIHSTSPRPVTFAPNVTPVTYVEPDESSLTTPEPDSPTSKLFPPSELAAPAPSRRRVPPGKRRSMGYIPRPPNAFMLFRADFVRQKHVPGSIETNHGSLSKIIGNCWRALPLEEKRVWEVKAKHAKAEHKQRYPEYRFRPVHNKNKDKKKVEKQVTTVEDERRCEDVAQLLLEGKKGDELAAAVRSLDNMRTANAMSAQGHRHPHHPQPHYPQHPFHRRSSSVPLPNDWHPHIALPALPFLTYSRTDSPVNGISRSQRMMLGQRRASSAGPVNFARGWGMPTPNSLHRDDSPLPEVDTSLFEPSFLDASSGFSFSAHPDGTPFSFNEILSSLPNSQTTMSPLDHTPLGPLDTIAPNALTYANADPLSWMPQPNSHSSSAYSGSPGPSENSLPLHAPQPQHIHTTPPIPDSHLWETLNSMQHVAPCQDNFSMPPHQNFVEPHHREYGMHHQEGFSPFESSNNVGIQNFSAGLENLFEPTSCMPSSNHGLPYAFEFNDIIHE